MHSGIIHLFFNMFVQLSIGLSYERQWGYPSETGLGFLLGTLKMIIIYVISGVGGVLLSCVLLPQTVSVGASGSIMGLVGAQAAHLLCTWSKPLPSASTGGSSSGAFAARVKLQQWITVIMIVAITFFFSFSSTTDWAGHLGGLVCGVLIGFGVFAFELPRVWLKILVSLAATVLLLAYLLTCSLVLHFVINV
jgi:membrane associated rhomboid family serine protease